MTKKTAPATKLSSAHSASFREALSRFATGVTVVTVGGRKKSDVPLGVTISSFAGVSLKPLQILFCLDEKSRALPAFKNRAVFAVNILAENQKRLAKSFARSGAHVFKKVAHTRAAAPLLKNAAAVLLCMVEKKIKSGDHTVVIGRVKKIMLAKENPLPLLHAQRGYWGLGKAKR